MTESGITVVTIARKPLSEGSIAENILLWGCGGLNIDATRLTCDDHPGVHKREGDVFSPTLKGKTKTKDSGVDNSLVNRYLLCAMKIKLSHWAKEQGISYITAYRWAKAGKIPELVTSPTGRLFIEKAKALPEETEATLYGRVSSSDQREDLNRQMERLRSFAASRGLVVREEICEVGSGLNGRRRKLLKVLSNPDSGVLVVEHRDRLTRFGFDYLEATLAASGRSIIVMNGSENKLDIMQDFIDVVTSMCSRIYGRRSAKNRAEKALKAASK